jgi:hypothetical protein
VERSQEHRLDTEVERSDFATCASEVTVESSDSGGRERLTKTRTRVRSREARTGRVRERNCGGRGGIAVVPQRVVPAP